MLGLVESLLRSGRTLINHRNNQFQIQYFYCEATQEAEEKASSMETIANWGIRIRILKPVLP